jgi:hypothetical protein
MHWAEAALRRRAWPPGGWAAPCAGGSERGAAGGGEGVVHRTRNQAGPYRVLTDTTVGPFAVRRAHSARPPLRRPPAGRGRPALGAGRGRAGGRRGRGEGGTPNQQSSGTL